MARFLFTVWPFVGHINANLTVARELSIRGHEIAFYTGRQASKTIETEGYQFFPFQRVDEAEVTQIVLGVDGITASGLNLVKLLRLWRRFLLGTVPDQLADLGPVIDDWRPDVIVSDPCLWAPHLVLHDRRHLPVAMLLYVTACLLPGSDGPILGLALPRPDSWWTKMRNRTVRLALNAVSFTFRSTANSIRRDYGLAPLTMTVNEYQGQMPLYLIASIPELDYNRQDLPPSVKYVGALPWTPPQVDPPPPWLTLMPDDRPIIYVTEGTAQPQEPVLLRAAASGLAGLAAQVILTTGSKRDATDIGIAVVPPNVRIERWVPHHHLIPRISLLVTSGGNGTVMATLREGIPMVVVPMHWEQEETAWRIADAGAGICLPVSSCTPARLRAAVERVLGDTRYRQAAQRLALLLRNAPGPGGAADLLERLAAPQI
jgi:UDP:flavonoid glycosyltransferase YjiC (YdhE family)